MVYTLIPYLLEQKLTRAITLECCTFILAFMSIREVPPSPSSTYCCPTDCGTDVCQCILLCSTWDDAETRRYQLGQAVPENVVRNIPFKSQDLIGGQLFVEPNGTFGEYNKVISWRIILYTSRLECWDARSVCGCCTLSIKLGQRVGDAYVFSIRETKSATVISKNRQHSWPNHQNKRLTLLFPWLSIQYVSM